MRKVLVDRELLERTAAHLEWDGSEPMTTIQFAQKCDGLADELRRSIAQPAEAEGVEVVAWMADGEDCSDCITWTPTDNNSVALIRQADHLAALSAVTAERDRLRDAAGKAIAWLDAEQNGSGVGINRRIKLCRDAENSLRAALAAKEA